MFYCRYLQPFIKSTLTVWVTVWLGNTWYSSQIAVSVIVLLFFPYPICWIFWGTGVGHHYMELATAAPATSISEWTLRKKKKNTDKIRCPLGTHKKIKNKTGGYQNFSITTVQEHLPTFAEKQNKKTSNERTKWPCNRHTGRNQAHGVGTDGAVSTRWSYG